MGKKAKAKGTYGKPTSQQDKSVIRNDCTHFNDWAQRDIKWAAGFKKPTDVVGHCGSTHWNQVWKKNQKHLLDCQFSVTAGKTLTIQAGAVIYANKVGINGAYCSSAVEKQCTDKNECIKLASGRKFVKGKSCISNTPSLVVMKGAKIFAKGTAAAPITFTANLNSKDMPTTAKESADSSTGKKKTMYTRGNWGGLIVLGSAPVKGGSKNIEGLAGTKYKYGGSNIGDNSGVLQYVRAWHGGARIGADNEINGITFGGVGSGTVLENCEVALNLDDGFVFVGDDSFDTDKGYQGKMQYLFTMLGKAGHHGCEMDEDTMMKLHEGTAGAFGNMVLAPMKKLPAIKHSKCSQADGVRTVQKRSPGQLVANFEGVLYVAPNIVMHEVYPS